MIRPDLKSVKDSKVLAYIEHLESQNEGLSAAVRKSGFSTYMAVQSQIDSFNKQITVKEIEMPDPSDPGKMVKVVDGFIDLFADKDSKEFDRAFKYMEKSAALIEGQEKVYQLLTEVEKDKVQKFREGAAAERHVFKNK